MNIPLRTLTIACLVLCLLWGCSASNNRTEYVEDQPGLLTGHEKARIAEYIAALLTELDIQIKIVILDSSPADISREATRLFDIFALGNKTRGAKGLLFLIDPSGEQVRMEIGYDLEHLFTDGFMGYVERMQMAPFFRANRVGPGIEATVELLVGKALGAIDESYYTVQEARPRLGDHFSGGAGAETTVIIAHGSPNKAATSRAAEFGAQGTPRETLARYLEVLRLRIKDPHLGIYTPATRHFFETWIVTDAQQDNECRALENALSRGCVAVEGDSAVIRFPVSNRRVPPYFFRHDSNGWMLDFASMSRYIRFNHKNQWFFPTRDHQFMFAFRDVPFDRNGFPQEKTESQ